MSTTIEIHKLTRKFSNVTVVNELSLSVNSGEIFGLLGPNAAGKSTTIRLLAGILRADSGEAQVLGYNLLTEPEKIKHRIGYVAQQFSLYPDMTVKENIKFYAGLYNVTDKQILETLTARYGLTGFLDKRAGILSGGYKRRLAIACATPHNPELILLDEPTAGIDPVTRKELWDLFYTLATEGKTLFVTTHYMEEAERCNRLAFLNHGKRVAFGTPEEIRQSLSKRQVYAIQTAYNPQLHKRLQENKDIELVNQFGNELRVLCKDSLSIAELQNSLQSLNAASLNIHKVSPSIEDAFMSLTHNGNQL